MIPSDQGYSISIKQANGETSVISYNVAVLVTKFKYFILNNIRRNGKIRPQACSKPDSIEISLHDSMLPKLIFRPSLPPAMVLISYRALF